jgi:CRISPR-associated protein Cas5t
MSDTMRLLKVEAEGMITSFRYPHFMWQKHPTFEMPPPATIYGHICSALGYWVDPRGIQFAYRFTYQAKGEDLEHIWTWDDKKHHDTIKPFRRELLFRPRLTLYVNHPEWLESFRHPYYVVVLGRSQDLFCYTRLEIIEATQEEHAYYEHTLLPLEMVTRFRRGIPVTMPRFLDYERDREPTFAPYAMLKERVVYPALDPTDAAAPFVYEGDPTLRWIDPNTRDSKGIGYGLVFHSFVEWE